MWSRLTAVALVALALAPASAAAAVYVTAGPGELALAAMPSVIASPEAARRYYLGGSASGLGWPGDDRSEAGLLGSGAGALTTYRYIPDAVMSGIDLGSLLATRRALANLPLGSQVDSALVTTYSIVPESESMALVSPIPGTALLFGSALGGLGVLAWRRRPAA
jgi:hypothetical protein